MLRTILGIVLAILTAVSIVLMTIVKINIVSVNVGVILLALVIAYLVFSFGTLKVGEVGMLSAFGKSIGNIGPGLFFAPAGIVSVRKELGTVFQDELPADPEKIFRGDGKPPEGMFPPIRVKFGQPDPNDPEPLKSDPYNVAMVAEVVPVVSWHIKDAEQFFTVMGNVENCRKIMADKATEVFSDDFATKTPAKATLALDATSQRLEGKLKLETATWGIEIDDAYVKPIIFSHPLNESVVGVKIADQKKKATILAAEAEKQKQIEEATGKAEGIKLVADATKHQLIATGHANTDESGKIIELVPDANVRVQAEAVKALAGVKGTVVLGNPNVMLGIKKGEEQ